MKTSPPTLEGTYQYDALDRLTTRNATRRFYQDERIATEIEGERKTRFFETDSQPLALQQHGSGVSTTLLATDQQSSVLSGVSPDGTQHAQVYTPFGYHVNDALLSVMGFNGERPEPVTGHYLLGQGYRAFNPVLMRFNSPDSLSPFGKGGINAYTYCDNDPANKIDPTGHIPNFMKRALRSLGIIEHSTVSKLPTTIDEQIDKSNWLINEIAGKSAPLENPPKLFNLSENEALDLLKQAEIRQKIIYNENKKYIHKFGRLIDKRDKLQKANKDASSVIQKISNRAPHIDDVRHDFLMLEQEINTIKEYIVWFRSQ